MHKLAARLARGDEAAFAELYDVCADRLHRYASARLSSREEASDAVQSAFLRSVKSRRRFRNVENPIAYMFQIVRNESLRILSRRKGRQSHDPDSTWMQKLSAVEGRPATSESNEDAEMVAAALARLKDEDRELVALKIYGGLTFQEIALAIGMPSATVATRYRRALESLRPWLVKQLR